MTPPRTLTPPLVAMTTFALVAELCNLALLLFLPYPYPTQLFYFVLGFPCLYLGLLWYLYRRYPDRVLVTRKREPSRRSR